MRQPPLLVVWRKSTYSQAGSGNCVEVAELPSSGLTLRDFGESDGAQLGGAAAWRKSSRSQGGSGNWVEAVQAERWCLVRDSKDPDGAVLAFSRPEWAAFLAKVKDDAFDVG